ncbi:hypothetical protein [Mesoterricola sediminis]|uniref:Uncharacterized protein n=1 Tax=Mesoterricola sediminis TaxID=2927980 RepID=A0AA48KDY7_9BACT|nr:hypothetical protein [Mesoterricola sediminis]BDU78711.1 hypothetical protein METESE_36690 [Mesoterricola sediminis]
MRKRPVFGVIFLLTGLGLFGYLLGRGLLTEAGPPPGLPVPKDLVLETTNKEPFRQFDVIKWLGWAFVAAALAEVGAAYLRRPSTTVDQ